MDYQILVEADYLVNAGKGYESDKIRYAMEHVFKTKTGIGLLRSIYGVQNREYVKK